MNHSRITLPLLLALALCPYFVDLGGSSIWDANEAFYVETPREMMERGDYISPTFNYEPRLNKPVLSYWIVAGFYHLFGVSVGVQRVPIALSAAVLIATAALLAWAATPTRSAETRRDGLRLFSRNETALWAAIGLALSPRLLMFARRIFIDMYITMFMGLTLLFFALAERYPARRRLFLPLMYVAIGLGVLTKGPVAIVLPAAAFGVYLLVYRELPRIRAMMLPAGLAILTLLVVPYYAALYARHGWEPIVTFLVGENVARFTEGVGVDSPRGPAFYIPVVFSDSFPWSLFLFGAAASWVAGRRERSRDDGATRIRALLWVWIGAIVLFFTASTAKQDLYIFPIVPAVAALGAVAVSERWGLAVRGGAAAAGVVLAVAGAGMLYLIGSPNGVYGVDGAPLLGLVGIVGGMAICALVFAGRRQEVLYAIAVTFIVLSWVFVLRVLPGFERYKPVPGFADTLASRLAPDDLVVTYDEALPSLVFYLRRPVAPYFDADAFFETFRTGRTVYAVLSEENYARLAGDIGVPTCILERRPTFDVNLRTMLAREPLPHLVLITTRCAGS